MSNGNHIPVRDLTQQQGKIYTRSVEGFFQRIRLLSGWPLLLGYLLLPWLNWGGRQAVLFDLPARQFHVFNITFWPQDFPLLAWLLIIAAFMLFAVTVFAGRVWCGYTCPQTVWTAIFMWVEEFFEGSRNQRMRRDQGAWTADKVARKGAKHATWLVVAFWTGFTFVGYFSPIRDMTLRLGTLELGFWEIAWINFFTWATYINAGWLREQVCIYICPYARFQSVMFDEDTLIVSYDPARGEARGPRKRGSRPEHLGDCIDCELCVQVCPTGIDIRDGLQYQCITCALCIDACDSVMDKMNYPRGLIRYTTERALMGGTTRILRPRLVGYAVAVSVMVGLFGYALMTRVPLQLDVQRDRIQAYQQAADGSVHNLYAVKLLNKDQRPHRYRLWVTGARGEPVPLELEGREYIELEGGELREVPVRLSLPADASLPAPAVTVEFHAEATGAASIHARAESRFLGPRL